MNLTFSKYHGAGNDFVLIDERIESYSLNTDQIRFICDRHFGVGADGLMLLQPDDHFPFRMVYYNSDGNESTMCGNGGRCIIHFAHDLGLTDAYTRFVAIDGEHEGKILDSGLIRLKMQDAFFPVQQSDMHYIQTGSPHAVVFVGNIHQFPVVEEGRKIRHLPEFQPGGVNVDFVFVDNANVFIRTYERGVENETLACGTGVTAAVLTMASINPDLASPVKVQAVGGELSVSFIRNEDHFSEVWLEGPAQKVFTGTIQL